MESTYYIVVFATVDGDEETYYYNELKDAEYHASLFDDDDSGLYYSVSVVEISGDNERTIRLKTF